MNHIDHDEMTTHCYCRNQQCGCRCYCWEHSPVAVMRDPEHKYEIVILACELHAAAPNLKNVAMTYEEP